MGIAVGNIALTRSPISVKAVLNDRLILDLDLKDPVQQATRHDGTLAPPLKDRPRRGHIGFQELSRGDDHVQIRGARIKILR